MPPGFHVRLPLGQSAKQGRAGWYALVPPQAADKLAALVWLLREMLPSGQSTLVFASTRHHVEFLQQLLAAEGMEAAYVYGTMDQVISPPSVGATSDDVCLPAARRNCCRHP